MASRGAVAGSLESPCSEPGLILEPLVAVPEGPVSIFIAALSLRKNVMQKFPGAVITQDCINLLLKFTVSQFWKLVGRKQVSARVWGRSFLAFFQLPVVPGNPWCSLACGHSVPVSGSVFTWSSSLPGCVHVLVGFGCAFESWMLPTL